MKPQILSAILAALSPMGAIAQTTTPAPATEIPQAPTPRDPGKGQVPSAADFAAAAGAINLFEIQSATLALERGSNGVRALAQQLLDEHQKAHEELISAAREQSIPLEPKINAAQTKKLESIRDAPVDQFDNVFMSAQMVAHQSAMELVTLYGEKGEAGPLKAWAQSHYPTLRNHYLKARAASTP